MNWPSRHDHSCWLGCKTNQTPKKHLWTILKKKISLFFELESYKTCKYSRYYSNKIYLDLWLSSLFKPFIYTIFFCLQHLQIRGEGGIYEPKEMWVLKAVLPIYFEHPNHMFIPVDKRIILHSNLIFCLISQDCMDESFQDIPELRILRLTAKESQPQNAEFGRS